jgi:hypothetical protein
MATFFPWFASVPFLFGGNQKRKTFNERFHKKEKTFGRMADPVPFREKIFVSLNFSLAF